MTLLVITLVGIILSSLVKVDHVVDGYWIPKQATWAVSGIIIGLYGMMHTKALRELRNPWLTAFVLYVTGLFGLSFLWFHINTPIQVVALTGDARQTLNWNVGPIIPFVSILGSFLAVYMWATRLSQGQFIVVGRFIGWLGFIVAVFGWLQWFGIDLINARTGLGYSVPDKYSPGTFFGSPLASSAFLAVCAPFLFHPLSITQKIMLSVIVALLIVTKGGSLAALSSLYISGALYCWLTSQRRLFLLFVIGALCAFPFLVPKIIDFGGRWDGWIDITQKWISINPFFGLGLGSIRTLFLKESWRWYPLHNDLFQLFVETGFIGGCLFVLSIMKNIFGYFKSMDGLKASWAASGAAYLFVSFSSFPSHSGVLPIGCLIFAFLIQ